MNNPLVLSLIIVLLIALSAFFSGSEIAFSAANKQRLKLAAQSGGRREKLAFAISENFARTLSTVLVGNNLVNIAASSTATMMALYFFADVENSNTIAVAVMTVLIIIFGETLPKIVAAQNCNSIVYSMARPLRFFSWLFYPVVFIVTKIVDKLSPLWTPENLEPEVTDDDLVDILETIEEEGVFTEKEGELIRSAIEFSDVTAHDILTPRVDLFAFDIEDDVSELLKKEEIEKYSRVPVYQGSIDNIIGILSVKRLMKEWVANDGKVDVSEIIIQPPMFIHMTMATWDILKMFRRSHSHIAVVKDEYGGTMGIVTMEDVLEELVGEIWDERDDVVVSCTETSEGVYLVEGDMNIYDLFDEIGFKDDDFDSEYTTVGGWATEMLEHFPENGEEFVYKQIAVKVIKAENMLVEKLQVQYLPEEDPEDED